MFTIADAGLPHCIWCHSVPCPAELAQPGPSLDQCYYYIRNGQQCWRQGNVTELGSILSGAHRRKEASSFLCTCVLGSLSTVVSCKFINLSSLDRLSSVCSLLWSGHVQSPPQGPVKVMLCWSFSPRTPYLKPLFKEMHIISPFVKRVIITIIILFLLEDNL